MKAYDAGMFLGRLEEFMAGLLDSRDVGVGERFVYEVPGIPGKTRFRCTLEVVEVDDDE